MYAGQMQQAQCVRLAWRKRRVILPAKSCMRGLKNVLLRLNRFSMLFLLNLFKNLNLCTSYIKQIMNVFSFVQWNKYFHSVKEEMYHSTRLRLVEWNISSFTSWKYLYHCTHKHSLFVYCLEYKPAKCMLPTSDKWHNWHIDYFAIVWLPSTRE